MSKDNWSSKAYEEAASFVPQLTNKVVSWLDVKPGEKILDVGCGDGKLTGEIGQLGAEVVGVDSSAAMIEAANQAQYPSCTFHVGNGARLQLPGPYDKIFSNAALHWIMAPAATRANVIPGIYSQLKSGGTFVFEMGGHGNCADVHAALRSALLHRGVSPQSITNACPWYFPTLQHMRGLLDAAGFTVDRIETEYRPTLLPGGLESWVRLMGAAYLALLPEEQVEPAVAEVAEVLGGVIMPDEGGMWLGYVRLRAVATKRA